MNGVKGTAGGMSRCWFKHILFRRNGLGAAYNATMSSPEKYVQNTQPITLTHMHTHIHNTIKNRIFGNTQISPGVIVKRQMF